MKNNGKPVYLYRPHETAEKLTKRTVIFRNMNGQKKRN